MAGGWRNTRPCTGRARSRSCYGVLLGEVLAREITTDQTDTIWTVGFWEVRAVVNLQWVDGYARFGASGSWISARFLLAENDLYVQLTLTEGQSSRSYALGEITAIDEVAPADSGRQTIELTMREGDVLSAAVSQAFVQRLVDRLVSGPGATSSTSLPPPSTGSATEEPPVDAGATTAGAGRPAKHTAALVGLLAIAVIAAVLTVGAAYRFLWGDEQETLRGVFAAVDEDGVDGSALDCSGTGGFDDVSAGTNVKVTGPNGDIVGSGSTRNAETLQEIGEWVMAGQGDEDGWSSEEDVIDTVQQSEDVTCFVLFEVEVPRVDNYEVTLGSGRRGTTTYSATELDDQEWTIFLSLTS